MYFIFSRSSIRASYFIYSSFEPSFKELSGFFLMKLIARFVQKLSIKDVQKNFFRSERFEFSAETTIFSRALFGADNWKNGQKK